jgi:phosphate transport system substrate-binding protein
MYSRLIKCLSIILALFAFIVPAHANEKLSIAGDRCSIPLADALVGASGLEAELSQVGCAQGVYMAASGEAALGVSTQNGLDSNLPRGARNTVIARSPIVLIVNRDNRVSDISCAELQDLYKGKITNWKELGGEDLPIENVMLAPCVKHAMGKKIAQYDAGVNEYRPGRKVNPALHTNSAVEERRGAVGQQIYGYESQNVKVLSIDGVLPTDETLGTNYTFFQDYNVVTSGEPTGAALSLIEFARSEKGRAVIRSLKHVPVR